MKLIDQSYEILDQKGYKLEDIYKHIELCARTCYKSEDKITEDSAKEFVQRMINSGHKATLEHGAVYLKFEAPLHFLDYVTLKENKYTRVHTIENTDDPNKSIHYVSTNYRVIVENGLERMLQYLCEPTEYHIKRRTVKLTTNIHVYKDLTRHRNMSFAIESTRFCNYSKDKFNNELTFINPTSLLSNDHKKEFIHCLDFMESTYMYLIQKGCKPQQAAAILPQCTKADVIMTGFEDDWDYVFRLRTSMIAETGQPHPQVAELMDKMYEEFKALKNADR